MNPTREDCRGARAISEARHCQCPTASLLEDRDDFVGAVGRDVLPHLLPHDQKLKRALLENASTGKRVVDTPLHAAIFACVLLGAASGLALAAGWV